MGTGTLWGIHHRGAHDFLGEGIIMIGWPDAGDLTDLPEDRDRFKARLR